MKLTIVTIALVIAQAIPGFAAPVPQPDEIEDLVARAPAADDWRQSAKDAANRLPDAIPNTPLQDASEITMPKMNGLSKLNPGAGRMIGPHVGRIGLPPRLRTIGTAVSLAQTLAKSARNAQGASHAPSPSKKQLYGARGSSRKSGRHTKLGLRKSQQPSLHKLANGSKQSGMKPGRIVNNPQVKAQWQAAHRQEGRQKMSARWKAAGKKEKVQARRKTLSNARKSNAVKAKVFNKKVTGKRHKRDIALDIEERDFEIDELD
ncbi:hypothetical protein M408DRAFT_293649 [Serendipita vermifera MAFF 305830]|uniref:Uncharacterized protein n=1 Tax=Serendipita vermifera MAFF 305830 TaxID=933852 RepID=A0A0C2W6N0_SERVB|nr:hypothetical protein M408DRAFT_293649 [Serendipita vermifera MAFF 305830]